MPINRIAQSSTEIEYQNYLGITRSTQTPTDAGWATYVDAAGVNPVDGVSGTSNLTWNLNLINPLNADPDLRLVKDTANRQGQGVSIPFSIDNKHLGKNLQITFDMELISGTYLNAIIIPIPGTYSITSTTCTVTAPNSFSIGHVINMTVTVVSTGSAFPNGNYTITAANSSSFSFTIASGSGTGSCTFTALGDLRVSIIQDTTGTPTAVEPVNTDIALGIPFQKLKHIATFQTSTTIRNYRLCIHVSSTHPFPYTVDFANFRIWEPNQTVGAVITDWQNYIPTFQGFGTPVEINFQWRRIGGSIEIRGVFRSGTMTTAEPRIGLPSGLTTRILTLATETKQTVGIITRDASTPLGNYNVLALNNVNYFNFGHFRSDTSVNSMDIFTSASSFFGTNEDITLYASVPIQGFGSSVTLSSDSGDSRVIALYVQGTLTSSISADAALTWASLVTNQDTHGAYNFSTGIYTAPLLGYYTVSGFLNTNGGQNTIIRPWVNGINRISTFGYTTTTGFYTITGGIFLNAGDQLTLRPSGGYSAVSSGNFLYISRVSASSQTIATSETVAASYYSAASQISLSAQINFGVRIYDTHVAVTVGVGAWRFTAPMTGKYLVTGFIGNGSGASTFIDCFVNGVFERKAIHTTASGMTPISFTIHLFAGQFFDLRPAAPITITGNTTNDGARSRIDITRIGN